VSRVYHPSRVTGENDPHIRKTEPIYRGRTLVPARTAVTHGARPSSRAPELSRSPALPLPRSPAPEDHVGGLRRTMHDIAPQYMSLLFDDQHSLSLETRVRATRPRVGAQ
jgi:hypothetical protein